MKRTRLVSAALIAGALAVASHPLLAATTINSNFTVQANVPAKCIIKTGPATYDFGNYDPTSTSNLDAGSGSAVIKCAKGTAVSITISTTTAMGNGSDTLLHQFFQEAARTNNFSSVPLAVTSADHVDQTINFYGRIPSLQNVGTGLYTGTSSFNVAY